MAREYHRLVLLFIDGVGLAPEGADNPFTSASAPTIERIILGPMTQERCGQGEGWMLAGIDARLGIDGLPQSATGQATLFTGVNAARWMGRHVSGVPGPRLRALVAGRGLLRLASRSGARTTFANAYSSAYLERLAKGEVRPSVTSCLVEDAGLTFRSWENLATGEAVTWDIVGDLFGHIARADIDAIQPREAGRRLARLAGSHDLTVFETFLPDLAAHGRVGLSHQEVIDRLDGLLEGVLAEGQLDMTLVVTSDHGNFESMRDRSHTVNPVPLLAIGPRASSFTGVSSLSEVTPKILEILADVSSGVSG